MNQVHETFRKAMPLKKRCMQGLWDKASYQIPIQVLFSQYTEHYSCVRI